MDKQLQDQEWYEHLVDECKEIITEAVFTSRWALVEGYWTLGKRIRTDLNWDKFSQGLYTSQDLANAIGISERTLDYALQTYDKYKKLDLIPEGKNISWNKLITKYLTAQIKPILPLPAGKYNVIYTDPPWEYENTGFAMSAEKQYPTMSMEELKILNVANLAGENCILFMWATNPLLKDAIELMQSWTFEYKTNLVWIKKNHTAGFYVFGQHELLLIGIRGSILPIGKKPKSIIQGDNNIHSKKPEIVYEIIEQMYPNLKYVELFARNKRNGWESWGNEI